MLPIPTDEHGCFIPPEEPREYLHTCGQRDRDYEAGEWVCGVDGAPCGAHPEPPRMAHECPRFRVSATVCPICAYEEYAGIRSGAAPHLLVDDLDPFYDGDHPGDYYACPDCFLEGTGEVVAENWTGVVRDIAADMAYGRKHMALTPAIAAIQPINNARPEGPGEAA